MGGLLTLSGLGDSALSLPFFFTPSLPASRSLFLPFSESFFLEGSFSGPRMEEGEVGTHHLSLRNRKQTTVPFLSRLVGRLGGPRSGVCMPLSTHPPCQEEGPVLLEHWAPSEPHSGMVGRKEALVHATDLC